MFSAFTKGDDRDKTTSGQTDAYLNFLYVYSGAQFEGFFSMKRNYTLNNPLLNQVNFSIPSYQFTSYSWIYPDNAGSYGNPLCSGGGASPEFWSSVTFTPGGDLSINNLTVHGNINVIPTSGTTGSITAPGGLSTDSGVNYFKYTQGSWTPTLVGVISNNILSLYPGTTYTKQEGYYVKTGSTVKIWFDIEAVIDGNVAAYTVLPHVLFAGIGNLPFAAGVTGSPIDFMSTNELSISSFPNGFAGLIPAVGTPVYPYPYSGTIFENTYVYELYFYDVAVIDVGPWNSDGRTILIQGMSQTYGVAVDVPPTVLLTETLGPISNFNILTGINYNVAFKGSMEYLTND